MQAIRVARFFKMGVNPLPCALDDMDSEFTYKVDAIVRELDHQEAKMMKKQEEELKKLNRGKG
jgi:hypothetical protein